MDVTNDVTKTSQLDRKTTALFIVGGKKSGSQSENPFQLKSQEKKEIERRVRERERGNAKIPCLSNSLLLPFSQINPPDIGNVFFERDPPK